MSFCEISFLNFGYDNDNILFLVEILIKLDKHNFSLAIEEGILRGSNIFFLNTDSNKRFLCTFFSPVSFCSEFIAKSLVILYINKFPDLVNKKNCCKNPNCFVFINLIEIISSSMF